ncbi:MAG TPA: carbohydrate binding domain-containing protein [Pseudobacteroides sp.]|uniref:carbohydrate binding domain-containing protein n=1 Tax=Pseudobacteroides sp. TaxID=1968840 RepID=UPI002F94CFA0
MKIKFIYFLLCLMIFITSINDISAYNTGWYNASVKSIEEGSVPDVSSLVLDAPAGKYGFVQVKDGHFYFENGKRIKFWGVNFSFGANFPTHENAEKVANDLSKLGFNIVRLHHMDTEPSPVGIFKNGGNTLELDENQLDKLDYLIYQLKSKGIYINMNLLVGRKFKKSDGILEEINSNSKVAALFDDKLISLQKDYAKKVLTHYNKYTKMTYAEDPCLAMVEISNEYSIFATLNKDINSGLFYSIDNDLSKYYENMLDLKWSQWLKNKYGTLKALESAWGDKQETFTGNKVLNNSFEDYSLKPWMFEIHNGIKSNYTYDSNSTDGQKSIKVEVDKVMAKGYQLQLKQLGIQLKKGKRYLLTFNSKASNSKNINLNFMNNKSPYQNYGLNESFNITTSWNKYSTIFLSTENTDKNSRLSFSLGNSIGTIWFDDISLTELKQHGINDDEKGGFNSIKRTKWIDRMAVTPNRFNDNIEFYYSLEKIYFQDMLNFLKNELKVKTPTSTSSGYYGLTDLYAQCEGDFTNSHIYWDHPVFPEKPWDSKNFTMKNLSLIEQNGQTKSKNYLSGIIGSIAKSKVIDKPLVVSEINLCFPNNYEYELTPILAAYASLQDWDGIIFYSYSHNGNFINNKNMIENYFDLKSSSGKLSQMPSCSAFFLKSYLSKALKTITVDFPYDYIFKLFPESSIVEDIHKVIPSSLLYTHMLQTSLNSKSNISKLNSLTPEEYKKLINEDAHISDTGEIKWHAQKKNETIFVINSKKIQSATGFLKNRKIDLDNISLNLDKDCSVILCSMDEKDIDKSQRLLLSITGAQKNTDQRKSYKNGLTDWGKGPVLMERINGNISLLLDDTKSYDLYLLDTSGRRIKKLDYVKNEGKITIQWKYDGFWLEIQQ